MHFLLKSLTAVSILFAGADGVDRLDLVLTQWEKSQRDIQSLVVEFTREIPDRTFNTTQKNDGVFRMVRAPTGEIHASFELSPEKTKGGQPKQFVAQLNGLTVSILDYNRKTETRWKMAVPKTPPPIWIVRSAASWFSLTVAPQQSARSRHS